ncbi:unnamed protein product [Alopecurus aequalis]
MASTPTTTTTTCSHALLKGLRAKLQACAARLRTHYDIFPVSSTVSSALLPALAVLVCGTALSRVVSSESRAAKEVVLLCGDRVEVGLLEVYGDANASVYGDRRDVEVGCFLHRRPGGGWTKLGIDEDGKEVVFAGRVVVGGGVQEGAALEDELVALQVDRLAEGVWDRYFGGSSRWNYLTDGPEEMELS